MDRTQWRCEWDAWNLRREGWEMGDTRTALFDRAYCFAIRGQSMNHLYHQHQHQHELQHSTRISLNSAAPGRWGALGWRQNKGVADICNPSEHNLATNRETPHVIQN